MPECPSDDRDRRSLASFPVTTLDMAPGRRQRLSRLGKHHTGPPLPGDPSHEAHAVAFTVTAVTGTQVPGSPPREAAAPENSSFWNSEGARGAPGGLAGAGGTAGRGAGRVQPPRGPPRSRGRL